MWQTLNTLITPEVSTIITGTIMSPMRNLKHREAKQFIEDHKTNYRGMI